MSLDAIRSMILEQGTEIRVTVNQRMLIDKMLARYSSDFVIFRELIQNSDDARATRIQIDFTCQPAVNESTCSASSNGKHWKKPLITAKFGEKIIAPPAVSILPSDQLCTYQTNFHNSNISEIRLINDGNVFNEVDWKRVASIADGNVNVEAVGQFGVGFFSVFSWSEEPIIMSGKQCMVFTWRDDDSLTTFRHELPIEHQSELTSIILKTRHKFVLHDDSSPIVVIEEVQKSKINGTRPVTTKPLVPTVDLSHLKGYLVKG